MSMTKQDFEVVADRIKRNLAAGMDPLTLACLAEDLACDFALRNPRFDRERFLKACGVQPAGAIIAERNKVTQTLDGETPSGST